MPKSLWLYKLKKNLSDNISDSICRQLYIWQICHLLICGMPVLNPPILLCRVILEEELRKPHFSCAPDPLWLCQYRVLERAWVTGIGRRDVLLCICWLLLFYLLFLLWLISVSVLHPCCSSCPYQWQPLTSIRSFPKLADPFSEAFVHPQGLSSEFRQSSSHWAALFKNILFNISLFIWMDIKKTIILIGCMEITTTCIVFLSFSPEAKQEVWG